VRTTFGATAAKATKSSSVDKFSERV